ncbi:MAG: ATP-binding protein [Gammaproteobacteria bacterium]|nr:ATP-binding protein [Gammaproteobacteria bacterium]
MKELVVISGKGGTGKTSLAASFAILAGQAVIADCDVDASDLHLLLRPDIKSRHDFISGHEAVICQDECSGCGICLDYCRFDAIKLDDSKDSDGMFYIDKFSCEGCGVCVRFCPELAIDFPDNLCGEWMISETRCGPMVHAQLGVAAENSGKLVSMVRREALKIAQQQNKELIIVDGPPGIGCPVIASITGASQLLVVTEPSVSGESDLQRVLELAQHFNIPTAICINKWDINPEMSDRIEKGALLAGASLAGRIRYDRDVTQAQLQEKAVVETDAASNEDIHIVWEHVKAALYQRAVSEN